MPPSIVFPCPGPPTVSAGSLRLSDGSSVAVAVFPTVFCVNVLCPALLNSSIAAFDGGATPGTVSISSPWMTSFPAPSPMLRSAEPNPNTRIPRTVTAVVTIANPVPTVPPGRSATIPAPGWVVPSIVIGVDNVGRADCSTTVGTPLPGILNVIDPPPRVLATSIAWRSVHV